MHSTNEHAVLFVLDALTGSEIARIDTGGTGDRVTCNGMSTPIPVDADQDSTVDYVYAGDLKGNLWKFDFTDSSASNWAVAYGGSGTPEPLFQAKDSAGNFQPITTKPEVMFHCASDMPGYMVITATGKHLGNVDFSDTQTQTIYGLWDYGDDGDDDEYLGAFNRGATGDTPQLSNQPNKVTLLEQEEVYYGKPGNSNNTLRLMSQNEPVWITMADGDQNVNPSDSVDNHAGWYFDFPLTKERVIRNFMIRDGLVIFISSIPKESPCAAGGDSILHEMNACTGGGGVPMPQTDTNNDGVIDLNDEFGENDMVTVVDPNDPTGEVLMAPGSPRPQFDINGDGIIDFNDMVRVPNPNDPTRDILCGAHGHHVSGNDLSTENHAPS